MNPIENAYTDKKSIIMNDQLSTISTNINADSIKATYTMDNAILIESNSGVDSVRSAVSSAFANFVTNHKYENMVYNFLTLKNNLFVVKM